MPKRSEATARIYRGTPRNLARLARVLAGGGLVAVPTETVYGLAADALNAKACRAIFKAKRRPLHDPLIVHGATLRQLEALAHFPKEAHSLAKAFWPGPLTLVLPKKALVPGIVTAGLDSVAVRIPRSPLFRKLIALSGRPLAAPSANLFGYVSPTSAAHVFEGLGRRITYILEGGKSRIGLESTILDLRDPKKPTVLRPGIISAGELAHVLGIPVATKHSFVSPKVPTAAPGMLATHYSPRTRLVAYADLMERGVPTSFPDEAFIYMRSPAVKSVAKNTFTLTERGSLKEAARNLFAMLRQVDGKWQSINIEYANGDDPLVVAINDRIRRAAAKRAGPRD